jgi:hypothetical protein
VIGSLVTAIVLVAATQAILWRAGRRNGLVADGEALTHRAMRGLLMATSPSRSFSAARALALLALPAALLLLASATASAGPLVPPAAVALLGLCGVVWWAFALASPGSVQRGRILSALGIAGSTAVTPIGLALAVAGPQF